MQQTLPMATQQQFLAQQNAYAAHQQAAPYMHMPSQDGNPFMTAMLAPPSYYGVPPWVHYPGLTIPQQGAQVPRRPLTPSQGAENQPFVSIIWLMDLINIFFLITRRTNHFAYKYIP